MKKWILGAAMAISVVAAQAAIPAILLEACNSFDQADKRMECLKAANRSEQSNSRANAGIPMSAAQSAYAAPSHLTSPRAASTRNSSGSTCYTGPRGGTYTITASGRKNYSGC